MLKFTTDEEINELFSVFNGKLEDAIDILHKLDIHNEWHLFFKHKGETRETFILGAEARFKNLKLNENFKKEEILVIEFYWLPSFFKEVERVIIFAECDLKTLKKRIKSVANLMAFL